MHYHFEDKSNAEMRIELACAQAERPTTWKGRELKKDRIEACTKELLERGAF